MKNLLGLLWTVYESSNYCPENIALDYDIANKDICDRDGYPQERALIEAQTIYEWRRLFNLMKRSHV